MDKYIYDENNRLQYELQGITIFRALPCQSKKINLSAYEDNGTSGIFESIKRYSTLICWQTEN